MLTKLPPTYPVPGPVLPLHEVPAQRRLSILESESWVSLGNSQSCKPRKRSPSPATSSAFRSANSPVSGDLTGWHPRSHTASYECDNSLKRRVRAPLHSVGPTSPSLGLSPGSPLKNPAKPSGQTVRNKVSDNKVAKATYPSNGPEQEWSFPSTVLDYDEERYAMVVQSWRDLESDSDLDPEPARISPPASDTALVTDQSSTKQLHDSKRQRLS